MRPRRATTARTDPRQRAALHFFPGAIFWLAGSAHCPDAVNRVWRNGYSGHSEGRTVSPLAISAIAFVLIFGGALGGIALRRVLTEGRLSNDAKDAVRLSMGLIGTIAALVLGLLIASAKTSYDGKVTKLREIAVNVILADNLLQQYGSEALPARQLLRATVNSTIDHIWGDVAHTGPFEVSPAARAFYQAVETLTPRNDAQRALQARVLNLLTEVAQARLSLFAQSGNAIPLPFLAILIFWLAMIFASFSLFSRAEPVVIIALFVCSLSSACALLLIMEMDRPFSGVMTIPSNALRHALPPL
jgi:hypothetical protein